jgi:hypothetical protein
MFPILLGIYLLGTGTKRRVVQSLAGIGLYPSYIHLNKLIEKVADICKVTPTNSYQLLLTPTNSSAN